jgi:hypothetical protein
VDGDLGSIGYVRTLAVGLVAALDEADAVLGELTERVDNGVHGVHGFGRRARSRGLVAADCCAGFARASGSVVTRLLGSGDRPDLCFLSCGYRIAYQPIYTGPKKSGPYIARRHFFLGYVDLLPDKQCLH